MTDKFYFYNAANDIHFSRLSRQFLFPSPGGASFCKIVVKNCEKSKNLQKSLCPTSYRQLRDLKKNPLQQFRAKALDVHLYNIFFSISLYSADSNCQSSYRLSKNGLERTSYFVCPKGHTGSKFCTISLGLLCT